jgi:phosphatidylserine synthase
MALPLSRLFTDHLRSDYWIGSLVIVALSALNVVPIPYMTHRGRRAMQPWVKVCIGLFLITPVVVFFTARPYTFDVFLFFVLAYALGGWVPVHPDERRAFYGEYRKWQSTLAAA